MRVHPNMLANARRSIPIVLVLVFMSATSLSQTGLNRISSLFSKGHFDQIVAVAPEQIKRLSESKRIVEASQIAALTCRTYIQLERFDEAMRVVDHFISDPKLLDHSPRAVASLYFCKAASFRSQRVFEDAFKALHNAISMAPGDSETVAAYDLELGRTLYSAGHDFAAIVWLERAEKQALSNGHIDIYFDALRFLSLAWSAKFYYANALAYVEKLVEKTSRGEFEHRSRIAYFEYANLLGSTGQPKRAKDIYLKGLSLSRRAKANYHAGLFLSSLMLSSFYENDFESGEKYLLQLAAIDKESKYTFNRFLGSALVEHFRGNTSLSDKYFAKLKNENRTSEFIIPYWRTTIAEQTRNWKELVFNAERLRDLTEKLNYQEDLPGIYYKLALGSLRLGDESNARNYANKALALFEPFRNDANVNLSIAMIEDHHSVYRLLSEIGSGRDPEKAFEYSERLKANLLRDRIERSVLKPRPDLSDSIRNQLFTTSRNYVEGKEKEAALTKLENGIVSDKQTDSELTQDFSTQGLRLPYDAAIVSYEFTPSGQLLAFVLESAMPLRAVELNITDEQVSKFASETQTKIRDRIFFKNYGKKLYDLLLKPLDLKSRQLVIVPDKLLWRIPFHALSPDGNKYLIETNTVSYSPSVYLLKQLLSSEPPRRQTIQIFANDTFNNQKLTYVNSEAKSIGDLFGTTPRLRATKSDFLKSAAETDILHFSMHAKLEGEHPLSSFLAFQQTAADSGRLTVNDLLSVRLKPNSLAFLASCDTSKVHSGEGLVSIPWAMLGSGSSSVISSQWDASDKSTQLIATAFYAAYLSGHSTAYALQKATVSVIRNKSSGFHEPYYWANFTLNGDFR